MGEKNYAIKTAERKKSDLTSTVLDATAQIKGLDDELKTLGNEMADKESELNAATSVRKAENADFQSTEKELLASITEIEKVIILLKRSQSASFLQGGARRVDPSAVKIVGALGSIVD